MDNNTKMQLKGELQAIKSQMPLTFGLAAAVGGQIVYPLPMGGVITITAFQQISQALKMQGEAVERMVKLVEKVIDNS